MDAVADKPFVCNVCGKSYKFEMILTEHKKIHTGEKAYECNICGKTFPRNYSLIEHKRTHVGEKPYECEICKKTFAIDSALAYHRKIHSDEKPYKCEIGKKTFCQSSNLATRMKIHKSEKPYEYCKTSAQLKKFNTKNIEPSFDKNVFVACSETMKVENIKEEINGEESKKPYQHIKIPAQLTKLNTTKNIEPSFDKNTFVDCGETIKVEDIKEEINEEESEKPYEYCKTPAHLKILDTKNIKPSFDKNIFVDCGETIKVENIKEEINEEESVEDPLSIHQEAENSNICEEIKEEVKEEESVDVPFSIQEGKRR